MNKNLKTCQRKSILRTSIDKEGNITSSMDKDLVYFNQNQNNDFELDRDCNIKIKDNVIGENYTNNILTENHEHSTEENRNINRNSKYFNSNEPIFEKENCDMTSNNDTLNATEKIIFRNKTKTHTKAPKKRVSFHEDILKSARTNNIHIEHGFITYSGGNVQPGRHSWCSNESYKSKCEQYCNCICSHCGKATRSPNILNYFNETFKFENVDKSDNANLRKKNGDINSSDKKSTGKTVFSSSIPNLGIGETIERKLNSRKNQYMKSSSCECIGSGTNEYMIGDEAIYQLSSSDPSIDSPFKKASCIKENKNAYNINSMIHDGFLAEKLSNGNQTNIVDKSKALLETFKDMLIPQATERGIIETTESEIEADEDFRKQTEKATTISRLKYLSKSLDGEKNDISNITGHEKKFIHKVDEHLRNRDMTAEDSPQMSSFEIVKRNEKFHEEMEEEYIECEEIIHSPEKSITQFEGNIPKNKYIVNCVSTVFEHTGVSYINEKSPNAKSETASVEESLLNGFNTQLQPVKQSFVNMFKFIKKSVLPTSPQPSNQIRNEKSKIEVEKKSPLRNLESNFDKRQKPIVQTRNYKQKFEENKLIQDNKNESSANFVRKNLIFDVPIFEDNRKNSFTDLKQSIPLDESDEIIYPVKHFVPIPNRKLQMIPDLFNSFQYDLNYLNYNFFNRKLNRDKLKNQSNHSSNSASENCVPDFDDLTKKLDQIDTFSDALNVSLMYFLKSSQSFVFNYSLYSDEEKYKNVNSSVKNNMVFMKKMKDCKSFRGSLFIKGVKPLSQELIKDLNTKIQNEIENSGIDLQLKEFISVSKNKICKLSLENSRFEMNFKDIQFDIFKRNCSDLANKKYGNLLQVLKSCIAPPDKLMLIKNGNGKRFCDGYISKYNDSRVILMLPNGFIIILSNVSNDTKQELSEKFKSENDKITNLNQNQKFAVDNLNLLQNFFEKNIMLAHPKNRISMVCLMVPTTLTLANRKTIEI